MDSNKQKNNDPKTDEVGESALSPNNEGITSISPVQAGSNFLQFKVSAVSTATGTVAGIVTGSGGSSNVAGGPVVGTNVKNTNLTSANVASSTIAVATGASTKAGSAAGTEKQYLIPHQLCDNYSSTPAFIAGAYQGGVHNNSIQFQRINKNIEGTNPYATKISSGSTGETDSILNQTSFITRDGSGSAPEKDMVNINLARLENIFLTDINRKLGDFSKEMSENRKGVAESKRKISKIMSSLTKQAEEMQGFDTSLKSAEEKLEGKVKGFEAEVVTARNSLLAVIALFASFFTFISISVNVFSRDMSLATSISVLLVIWSCLISFIFIFMAGISKGGEFFTSSAFIKHALFMVMLFICSFGLPRVIFSIFSIS